MLSGGSISAGLSNAGGNNDSVIGVRLSGDGDRIDEYYGRVSGGSSGNGRLSGGINRSRVSGDGDKIAFANVMDG